MVRNTTSGVTMEQCHICDTVSKNATWFVQGRRMKPWELPHLHETRVDFDDMLPDEHWTIPRVILVSIAGLLLMWWFAVLFLSAFSERPLT